MRRLQATVRPRISAGVCVRVCWKMSSLTRFRTVQAVTLMPASADMAEKTWSSRLFRFRYLAKGSLSVWPDNGDGDGSLMEPYNRVLRPLVGRVTAKARTSPPRDDSDARIMLESILQYRCMVGCRVRSRTRTAPTSCQSMAGRPVVFVLRRSESASPGPSRTREADGQPVCCSGAVDRSGTAAVQYRSCDAVRAAYGSVRSRIGGWFCKCARTSNLDFCY